MKPRLEQQLKDKYPRILDGLQTPIAVDDGWYALLDELCSNLMLDIEHSGKECKPVQVKEKLGTLRFYDWSPNKSLQREALLEAVYAQSSHTCDVCGDEAELVREAGWLRVRCQLHIDDRADLCYR